MKACLMLLALTLSWQVLGNDYCYCDVTAIAPLASSRATPPYEIIKAKMTYFSDFGLESQNACKTECRLKVMAELQSFKEELTAWTGQLVAGGFHGRNCTGPTDVKIPVRAKARLGNYSLGLAHEAMVFVHNPLTCAN